MVERTFLIQRYCSGNWPQIRGIRPFIVSGPSFAEWVIDGSLERLGRHSLRGDIERTLNRAFPPGGMHRRCYQHRAASEMLLSEGVLCALWSIDSRECLPVDMRWMESIEQVSRELPFRHPSGNSFWEIADSVRELISGMPSPAMAREYVSDDKLTLEPITQRR